jgi:serine phosphatase RsbU (regulator of sigma subunit)/type II secretory pathway pseudopilin PulG
VSRASIVVLLVGIVATAALSWVSYTVNDHNETRLLQLQVKQAGSVLQVVLPTLQTPLASAAEIAATSGGDVGRFQSYMSAYVGPTETFVSASLWSLAGAVPHMVAQVGSAPELGAVPARVGTFFAQAARTRQLSVIGLLGAARPRLGYGFTSAEPSPAYAVYAESSLPADRRVPVQPAGSAFSSLRYALFLGHSADPKMFLESDSGTSRIDGRTATVVVAFGTDALTLVAAPNGQLGGTLSGWLWWLLGAAGAVLSIAACLITERLVRRRRAAEDLAHEVAHLLGEQRGIAEALQHALLPQAMPEIPGVQIGVRYIPGVNGVEIGGDWYDVIALDESRFFFVVGDVSGRGVGAGTVMAAMHFAIRGFVSEGHPPATVLDRLRGLLDVVRDDHFATVVCGVGDIARHELTIANAGHLPPLLVAAGRGEFVATELGPPIGLPLRAASEPVTVTVGPQATLLIYTDGLVERRGESIDVGLSRLRDAAVLPQNSVEGLLSALVRELLPDGCDDDTAILGVRWTQ